MYFISAAVILLASLALIVRVSRTAGYTWTDYKTNTQIAKELKTTPILKKITGIEEKMDTTCK